MSREFYQAVEAMHANRTDTFAANDDGIQRHVEVRIDDQIYVYLYEDGCHIQTQHVDIPDRWQGNWPSDATVKRHVRRYSNIGSARITNLNA